MAIGLSIIETNRRKTELERYKYVTADVVNNFDNAAHGLFKNGFFKKKKDVASQGINSVVPNNIILGR